jgi:outer membrane protein assembly factor BamB
MRSVVSARAPVSTVHAIPPEEETMLARAIVFAAVLVGLSVHATAQVEFAWSATHDGNTGSLDKTTISASAPFPTGGIVAACTVSYTTVSQPPQTVYEAVDVVRWSDTGLQIWSVRLSGPTRAEAIAVDAQGAIFVGTSGDAGYHVFRLDANGAVQWDGVLQDVGMLEKLVLSPIGDVIVAGESGPQPQDMRVAACAADGTPRWSTTIDGPQHGIDTVTTLACDSLGNVVVTGGFAHIGGVDRGVVKLDSNGQVLWSRPVVGSASNAHACAIATNGDVIVGGDHYQGDPTYLVRLDSAGNTLWESDWDDPVGIDEEIVDVKVAADESIWALAKTYQGAFPNQTLHLVLLRYDANGTLLSAYVHQPAGQELEFPTALLSGGAGQFWAVAESLVGLSSGHEESLVIQFDSAGGRDWVRSIDTDPVLVDENLYDAVLAPGDQIVLTGSSGHEHPFDLGYAFALDIGASPQAYCVAKENSLGCSPAITFIGESSAGATSGFTVSAWNELNQKTGMLLYSVVGAASTPFQGGILCLQSPLRRTPAHSSGGSPLPAQDCSGSYVIDMNAFAHGALGGNPDASLLVPGTSVWCQAWGRDPGFAAPNNTSLSNGLRYVVLP